MIHESFPWKTQLARDADLIERWAAKPSASERRSLLIERKVFLAAYAMRKLDDAAKLSTSVLASPLLITRYPPTKAGFSEVIGLSYDRHFDLEKPRRQELLGRRVLNLLVHSLVFVEVVGEAETYDAFMVTSDSERARGLVQVELSAFVGLMRRAANDYPTVVIRSLDSTTGKLCTRIGRSEPSPGSPYSRPS